MDIDKEILKGYIDTLILSLLDDGDLYGFEMAKIVRERSGGTFELKEGTMYLALKRLELATLIEHYWGEHSGGGRRKYYRILAAGRERLAQKRREWTFVKSMLDLFLEEPV